MISRCRHVVYIILNITLSYVLGLCFSWALFHSTVHNLHFIGLVSLLLYLSAAAMLELCIEEKYKADYPLLMTCIPHFIKILQCVWKIFDFINSNSYCVA